ncbi:MAG: hypothetical protein ABDH20_00840 [Thermus sp.]
MEEKRHILQMVQAGEIGVEEALALLGALEGARPPARVPARLLRVLVQGWDEGKPLKVQVNLPLALADLVEGFLPEEAKLAMGKSGVNLKDLLSRVREGLPEGKLVEVEAEEEEGPIRVLVEVV